jgi:hypothetical protein
MYMCIHVNICMCIYIYTSPSSPKNSSPLSGKGKSCAVKHLTQYGHYLGGG